MVFSRGWQATLEEGYAKLELAMIDNANASMTGAPFADDAAIPRMSVNEAINLLEAHHARVHGGPGRRHDWRLQDPDIEVVKANLARKLAAIRRTHAENFT